MSTTWTPVIASATFTPNPASAGAPVLLSVIAVDVPSGEQEAVYVLNEFYCGEV